MVQHQPWHNFLKLCGFKNDVELRDWMRAYRIIAKASRLDVKLFDDCASQGLSDLPRIGIKVDMGVIAFDFGHQSPPILCSIRSARRRRLRRRWRPPRR